MLSGKSVLVTGGTGSFGKRFIKRIIESYDVKRIVVLSRDELKQFEMSNDPFFKEHKQKIRYFIGDVRDRGRLLRAFEGIDYVVHAAALKQVPAAEYNPMECIKTNVLGAENVIEAALQMGVTRVVALSTDKATSPVNLYGATKLCSDKLFIAANNMVGSRDLRLSVVRYGNVLGSRGSVIPFFLTKKNDGEIPITDERMTRFSISLDDGVDLVLYALENQLGGELFVPKIPSYKIGDVASAIAPDAKQKTVGIRPGEKIHEEMISETDSLYTIDIGKYYVITPSTPKWPIDEYVNHYKGEKVPFGFKYNSGENEHFLTVEEIRKEIKTHVDPSFEV